MMTKEKTFVDDSQCANSTPFNAEEFHAAEFYKTIKEFYSFASPSHFIKANNDLLSTFLEVGLGAEEPFTPKYLKEIIFMIGVQNQFLIELKENYEMFKKYSKYKT